MNEEKPILVYYRIRANAEVIRMLLFEIGVDFKDEFIAHDGIPPYLTDQYQMELRDVPYFIHQGFCICGIWAIIKYCCLKFNRPDLMGNTVEDQTRVVEIATKYMGERSVLVNKIFNSLKQVARQQQISSSLPLIKTKSFEFMNNSKYFKACRKMYLETNKYLRSHLTIIDFIFFSTCSFMMLLFSKEVSGDPLLTSFISFFKQTEFYEKHKEKIELYPYYNQQIDTNVKRVLQMYIREQQEGIQPEGTMNDN